MNMIPDTNFDIPEDAQCPPGTDPHEDADCAISQEALS